MIRFLYVESDGVHFDKNQKRLLAHTKCCKALRRGIMDVLWAHSVDEAIRLLQDSKTQDAPINAVISGVRLTSPTNKDADLPALARFLSRECPKVALFVLHTPPSYEPENGVIRGTSEQYIVKALRLKPKQLFHRYTHGLPGVIMEVLRRSVNAVKTKNAEASAALATKVGGTKEKSPEPVKTRSFISPCSSSAPPMC